MKKRTIISLLLVACMATMCFVGSTFAKYTSTVTGSSTATVAKWAFTSNENNLDLDGPATIAFNLFNTIKDEDGTEAETDVKTGKIAPGTAGAFDLKLENRSEVNAQYAVTFAVTNTKNIPIVISYGGKDYAWTDGEFKNGDTVLAIAATDIAMDDEADGGADEKTEAFTWKWAFEDSRDSDDTALGIAAADGTAPEITVTATVTLTQVN